jgi:hypothetical protein
MNSLPKRVAFKSDLAFLDDEKEMHYKLTFSEFKKMINNPDFSLYIFNRVVSNDHVNDIYNQIVKCYHRNLNINFYNNFKLCNIKDTRGLQLIDGQHRYYALKRFIDEINPKFTVEPVFNVSIYLVEDEYEIERIFSIINNTLPITSDEINKQKLVKIVQSLKKKYPDYIKEVKTKRPRIKVDELMQTMQDKKIMNVLPKDKYVEIVLAYIYTINKNLAKKTHSYFGTDKNMNVMFESAKNIDFYLGLDESYKWIDDLFQILFNENGEVDKSKKYQISPILVKYLKLGNEYLEKIDKVAFKTIQQKFIKKMNKNKDKLPEVCKKLNLQYDADESLEALSERAWKLYTKKDKK